MSLPKFLSNKAFYTTAWPTLAWAALIGLILAVVQHYFGQYERLAAWKQDQAILAQNDLLAIKTLIESQAAIQSAETTTSAKLEWIERAVENLAHGELKRSVVNLKSDAEPAKDATTPQESHIRWSNEPNQYLQLRATSSFDQGDEQHQQLILSRRFAWNQIDTSQPWSWLKAMGILGLVCCIGLGIAYSRFQRLQLLSAMEEWTLLHQSDTAREALVESKLARTDGTIAKLLGRMSDSTRDQLEQVQQSAEQAMLLMSAMPIGVLAFDHEHRLLFVNRAGRELLDLTTATRLGRPLIEVIRQPKVVNLIQQVSEQPQVQEVELELPLSKATLRLRAHPLNEMETSQSVDAPSGVLLTISDETRLKQLENARQDFTANVSHELKTPLSAIKAYAETLLMGALEDEEASVKFVERISEQAARLDDLIHDLLHLTKLQSQPDRPTLVPLSLVDVLKTCMEEHRTIGHAKNVTIDASQVQPDCRVMADLESLRTILGNLFSNAIRYNRPGGWVRVSSQKEASHVVILIEDNGIGIPPEDLERIFERFYRVEKARSQDAGGTGLGLAIVKHLVQSISGEIRVRSILGQGSTFELRLPSAP